MLQQHQIAGGIYAKRFHSISPMEIASCSILGTGGVVGDAIATASINRGFFPIPSSSHRKTRNHNLQWFSSSLKRKCLKVQVFSSSDSSSSFPQQNPSHQLALLLEVDGVLLDAYRLGNRQAFNLAFQKLGLDCANWSEPVYLDLSKKAAGDEERMLILYFNRIGWPTSLPTNEKEAFVKSVMREKKAGLDNLVAETLPLRPGVADFIDTACTEGVTVVILISYSKSGERIARSIVEKLGNERVSQVKVVGKDEIENSMYAQLALGKALSSLDEQLAKEARKAASAEKQRIAEEVASMLKLSVDIDTTSSESLERIVVALRGGAEVAGVEVSKCVLVAGSQPGVAAAERIGMPCVVVRSSFTSRAEFPSAMAVTDGFGGADLTVAKLRKKVWSSNM